MPLTIAVLVLSGLSDGLDGIIARKFDMVTDLGKLLDPFADKLTQIAIAVAICITHNKLIPLLILFALKELLMLCGSLRLLKKGQRPCEAQWYGKVATVVFYLAMLIILIFNDKITPLIQIVLTSTAALFMLNAFIRYSMIFKKIRGSDSVKETKKEIS